uniref:Uncharacterized protein n=1 Tax=Arundo donax TaxID=35708 RepID=A0A0A9A931_ARUDO
MYFLVFLCFCHIFVNPLRVIYFVVQNSMNFIVIKHILR